MSSLVAAVSELRTGVLILTNELLPTGATLATLRNPVLVTPMLGGWPGAGGGVSVSWPGLAAPPIAVSDWFKTRPLANKNDPFAATPRGP
jgi:hypothetical protein